MYAKGQNGDPEKLENAGNTQKIINYKRTLSTPKVSHLLTPLCLVPGRHGDVRAKLALLERHLAASGGISPHVDDAEAPGAELGLAHPAEALGGCGHLCKARKGA